MKKEFIMSEEERTVKRRKIEENRMKKTKPIKQVKGSNSKKKMTLLSNRRGTTNKKRNIKSEAESENSNYSDSDISPLDINSPESSQENSTSLISKILPGSHHVSLHNSSAGIKIYMLSFLFKNVVYHS